MSARGLGRGFDSLIPTELLDESFDPTASQDDRISELRNIKLDQIIPDPDQPRRHFEETALQEMAASIAEHGVLQPIVVVPKNGGYQIVAGERRYRAAKLVGFDKIPALVRTLSDQHKLEISLIENLQRRNLNILETATAYLKLRDQFNLKLDQIGQRVGGKSVSTISNTIRLLRLPKSVHEALIEGRLSEGQVRPLINCETEVIERILPTILKEDWSARKIEQFVVELKKTGALPPQKTPRKLTPAPYQDDVKKLVNRFKTDISVKTNAKGAGQITIRFKSDEDFRRIQKLLD